jgi:GDP-L-fucose synthase
LAIAYAIAKIAGIKLCESYNRQYGVDYRSVMPTNLYGLGDNYHSENSHVIPALIRRFHEAKLNNLESVVIWGSGKAKREFLYVDDMAEGSIYAMNLDKSFYDKHVKPMQSHINIGSGEDITIQELAICIKKVVGYQGAIEFDISKPDGTKRKLMDNSLAAKLGWSPKIDLESGLRLTYQDFISNQELLRLN